MTELVTYINVLDDAVKIGLGALIGGTTSLLALKLTNAHARETRYFEKKREHLLEVFTDISRITIVFNTYWASVRNIIQDKDDGKTITLQQIKILVSIDQKLFDEFAVMTNCINKLIMVDEDKVSIALEELGYEMDAFYKCISPPTIDITGVEAERYKDGVKKKRRGFMTSMRDAYRKCL